MILFDVFDNLLQRLPVVLGQALWKQCPFTTGYGETLVKSDGSMATLVVVHGALRAYEGQELNERFASLGKLLNAVCRQPGYSIDWVFQRDTSSVGAMLDDQLNGCRASARRMNLDVGFIFDDRRRVLARNLLDEVSYLLISTSPEALPKAQRKAMTSWSAGRMTQSELCFTYLRARHESMVKNITDNLAKFFSLHLESLEAHDALSGIARLWDAEYAKNFRPILPGDKVTPRGNAFLRGSRSGDQVFPTHIGMQIFAREPVLGDRNDTFTLGNAHYAAGHFERLPEEPQPFRALLSRDPRELIPRDIPFRISFQFTSGDVSSKLTMRKVLAQFLSFQQQNAAIARALGELQDQIKNGHLAFDCRISLVTWGESEQQTRTRFSMLASALEGWGHGHVVPEYGDPIRAALGTLPGFRSIGPTLFPPADEVVTMLPVEQPVSPWRHGTCLFRTEDDKLFPYSVGSSLQTSWIDLIFALPGSGKSVLMAILNLATCLAAGLERLPRIAHVDVGPSARGFIELLRATLPKDKQYLALHRKLRQRREDAMNPFDTLLGCRYPVPEERAFLVNFLSILLTPVGQDQPWPGIVELADLLITNAYRYYSEVAPFQYEVGVSAVVDQALERQGKVAGAGTTWWEVVDVLFELKEYRAAEFAQRHAVPTVPALGQVLNDTPAIKDQYAEVKVEGGERLLAACSRMLSSIGDRYPILSYPTALDLGSARVIAVDLQEVTPQGGPEAARQSEIMYMTARAFVARGFYMDEDAVSGMPANVRVYHAERLRQERRDVKRLNYDEFHRARNEGSKHQAVLSQVERDIREGRKFRVQITLSSQSDKDFTDRMREFATGFWVLKADSKAIIDRLAEVMQLSDYAKSVMQSKLTGPTRRGTPCLYFGKTKQGIVERIIGIEIGGVELWSYATTPIDVEVVRQCALTLGFGPAVTRLADRFPGGSCASEVERRIEASHGALSQDNVMQQIIEEVLRDENRNKAA